LARKAHHLDKVGVLLGFHKGGVPSITYGEALDLALAYAWIDSVIRRIDDARYTRKFTPRRPGSVWSELNVERVSKLTREGRMMSVEGRRATGPSFRPSPGI